MMENRKSVLIGAVRKIDLSISLFSFLVAYLLIANKKMDYNFLNPLAMQIRLYDLVLMLCFLYVYKTFFTMLDLYSPRRLLGARKELKDLTLAISLVAFMLAILGRMLGSNVIDLKFVGVFWIICIMFSMASRFTLRKIARRIRLNKRNLRFIAIVGTNQRAIDFYNKISESPEYGYVVKGFVDDEWEQIGAINELKEKLVSNIDGFRKYLRENIIDEVMIALPLNSHYKEASVIFSACEEQGVTVRSLADLYNSKNGFKKLVESESGCLITYYNAKIFGWQAFIKRAIDIFISGIGIILLLPFLLLVALAIKITSPGPAIFVQKRIGLNKRVFDLYKFRTMHQDAEKRISDLEEYNEAQGPVFKMRHDPRITSLGKILRKLSVDELPQLINVYKGDMSLVGPRPLPLRDYHGFQEDWHRKRFCIKPGLTCLWQVNGRSSVDFDEWMKLDMEYIDQWSLILDLKIIFKTIPAVLIGTGAV